MHAMLRRACTAAALLLGLAAGTAHAVPSYARQTGSDCGACHVGAFGPQLTPYGIQFKLGGYTDTDGKDGKLPLSGMAVANFTRTKADLTEAPEHFSTNDNKALQELSVFLAGRLSDHIGAFVQSTYSGVDRKWAMDQMDLRWATTMPLFGRESTVGVSLNSNPTLTDPFNTLGQWRFPYTESDFGAGFGPSPLIENLASSVIGVNAYTLYDKHWYGELGLYDTLSVKGLRMFNADDVGRFKGLAPYWRAGYFQDDKRSAWHVGVVGLHAGLQPDRAAGGPSDRYTDFGLDGGWQWLGTREHVFTVNGSWMHERQTLDATFAGGGADQAKQTLHTLRLAGSYHWQQTWGASLGLFDARGSHDNGLWGGSGNSTPDTRGYVLQADWTPWGKETSWGAPWANLRLGLQYTGYSRCNGGSSYLDEASGAPRSAHDNNTMMLFAWFAL